MASKLTRSKLTASKDVLIVGGGAVGLFLACRLAQLGLGVRVLERRTSPQAHSRAIGIHPPALERLAELGLAEAFVREGVRITRGHAYAGTKRLGTLDFGACPPPYAFVLSLPQPRTEALLAERLEKLAPGARCCGVDILNVETGEAETRVRLSSGEHVRAAYLVAADGKGSAVRAQLGIPFRGRSYPDTYLMGDFADTTDMGSDAALYFTRAGLIESFPLPGGVRRWVVKTPQYVVSPTPKGLAGLVQERLGVELLEETNTMLSAFGVQRFLAERFVQGRVALVGDAAHVLSPIGGQGMNLGWLGAWRLAEGLASGKGLNAYAQHRRSARQAIRRAEFNTVMGRATPLAPVRNALAWSILHTPLEKRFARTFTMRGL